MRQSHTAVNNRYYYIAVTGGIILPYLLDVDILSGIMAVDIMPLVAEISVVEDGRAATNLAHGLGALDAGHCLKFADSLGNGSILLVSNLVEAVKAFPAGTLLVFAGIGENPFHSLDSELIDSRIESH